MVTFCLGTVQAQSSKITGYVKDQSGEPLIGVNVMEKGTTNGTVTDLNGFYSIVVKASNAVLKFSYIGYKNQEIPVFPRIKIGVGEKPKKYDLADYVLGHFSKEDRELMEEGYDRADHAVGMILNGEIEAAMNQYNRKVKPKEA